MAKGRKTNLELRRRIKKAEAEKREETVKANPVTVVTGDEDKSVLSFEQWWMLIGKKIKIKPWMKEIVLVDFKARGLSESETEEKYNEALRMFGLKW